MIALALAVFAAQPGGFPVALVASRPGDTINLKAGAHGLVRLTNRRDLTLNWMPGATGSLAIVKSSGIVSRGGLLTNPGGYAVQVQGSSGVSLFLPVIRASDRAIVFDRSTDFAVTGADIAGMAVDGINIASSQRGRIIGTKCRAFAQIDDRHPDCIQGWSRPDTGVTSDILIQGSDIEGNFQGIFFGNHVRDGVDDGGFDRITVRANKVTVSFPNGIRLDACRQCSMVNNVVRTVPGSAFQTRAYTVGGSVTMTGNDVGAMP
ncbi:MAG: hypothetical protein ABW200_19355 [Hyphomicrobiaceae bacterium]